MESMTRNYRSNAIFIERWLAFGVSLAKAARDCIMAIGESRENKGRDK